VIGRDDLAEKFAQGSTRLGRREELNQLMAEWCAERTADEVMKHVLEAGLAFAKVRDYAEAARDPHVLERDMLQSVVSPCGMELPVTGPAVKFSRTPTRVRSAARELGADDDAILADLGLSADQVAALREQGIVRQQSRS
jgi:formyl-CoA transferase